MNFINREILFATIINEELLKSITGNLFWFLPEILLTTGILLLLILDLVIKNTRLNTVFSLFVLLVTLFIEVFINKSTESDIDFKLLFFDHFRLNGFISILKSTFYIGAIITIWFTFSKFRKGNVLEKSSEYLITILSIVLGTNLMMMSNSFLSLFITIEFVGLCSYCLVIFSNQKTSKEAAIKYFIYGIISSAIMLYGMSFIYGITGSGNYDQILNYFGNQAALSNLLSVALLLFLIGILFKISAFPLHIWVSDVYEGSNYPVIMMLSSLPKIGGVVVLYQLFSINIDFLDSLLFRALSIRELLTVITCVTISIGNILALRQNDIKRLMGYSSIAHAGFFLLVVISSNDLSQIGFIYYVIAYVIFNSVALIVLDYYTTSIESNKIEDLKGLGKLNVFYGVCILLSMIALIGFPPTNGFIGKLYLFTSLYESWQNSGENSMIVLFVVGLFNTVISLFYYLKIPYFIFIKSNDQCIELKNVGFDRIILGVLSLSIILQFLFTGQLFDIIKSLISYSG